MQSAPSEVSQNATSVETFDNQSSSSEHGISILPDLASGRLPGGGGREPLLSPDDTDSASVSSGSTRRGRRSNTRRVSDRGRSSQESSPGSRIEEYEKLHQYGRKKSPPLAFQVVASGKDKTKGISIDKFPNGKSAWENGIQVLTQCRGLDTCSLSFAPGNTLFHELGVQAILQARYDPSCMESRLRTILSWPRS